MASKIVITFGQDAVVGNEVLFERRDYYGVNPAIPIGEVFELPDPRTANFTVVTPQVISVQGLESAVNYVESFNIDYNGFNSFIVTRNVNVVTIEYYNDSFIFQNFSSSNINITAVITNVVQSTFLLSSAVKSANADTCNYYDLDIVATEAITSVIVNGVTTVVASNVSQSVKLIRGINNVISIKDVADVTVSVGTYYVDYLTSENITVGISQYLTGATLNVIVVNTIGLTLQYSLDNINWQVSNVFTGQTDGTKTLYVRDQFICVKSKEYTINSLGTRDPFLRISKANSINFSKVEVVDGCSIFANDENSLACATLQKYKHITDTLFQTCDTTTIQFKSNYDTVSAVLRNSNNVDTSLTITKKSDNLSRFKRLDGAWYYKYREGKLGIYFENGTSYTDEGAVIESYTLNGNLPEFAIIGQQISIDTLGIYEIVDVLYDEVKNKRVMIVNYVYASIEPVATIVESVYDVLPYEIYEFVIDWSLFSIGKYTVVITNTDEINGTVTDSSERISLLTEHLNTLAISYSNNNNKDIFYKYGIMHFIRIPYVKFMAVQQDENEINITDDNSVVVESTVHEKNEILFDVLTDQLMRKLVVALSSENLFVNGTGYVKDGGVSSENIDSTNLYEVTATLLKTNVSYNNYKPGESGIDGGTSTLEIPQIITDGANFIKT